MKANYEQRIRFIFGKFGPAQYIGHLDLIKTFERSFIRAGIPVAYSQGFNRRPRFSVASALPLGYTSKGELADIWLTEAMDPVAFQRDLNKKIAAGIEILEASEVPLSEPKLQTQITGASYRVSINDAVDTRDLLVRMNELLEADEIIRTKVRKKKTVPYDLRPLVIDMDLKSDDVEGSKLILRLVHEQNRSGRPDDVLRVLGLDPLSVKIERIEIFLGKASVTSSDNQELDAGSKD